MHLATSPAALGTTHQLTNLGGSPSFAALGAAVAALGRGPSEPLPLPHFVSRLREPAAEELPLRPLIDYVGAAMGPWRAETTLATLAAAGITPLCGHRTVEELVLVYLRWHAERLGSGETESE